MSADIFSDEETLFDTSEVSADELDSGGLVDKPGHFHMMVNGVQMIRPEKESDLPAIRVDMQVLADSKTGQKGKMLFHKIYLRSRDPDDPERKKVIPLSKGSMKAVLRFAVGMGLITKEQIGSPSLRIPWHMLDGKQCVAKVAMEPRKKDGKETGEHDARIPYGEVYDPRDERMSSVEKDPEAMALLAATAPLTSTDIDGI